LSLNGPRRDVAAWAVEVVLDFLAAAWVEAIQVEAIQEAAAAIRAVEAAIRNKAVDIRNRAAAIPAVDRPTAVTHRKMNR
jgi:hypothetical protein